MSVDIHTLAGAYALDAVSDIERAEFTRHLAVCAACAQEIAELRETVARLTDATAKTPPPRVKSSVLAAVTQTRQLPPARSQPAQVPRRGRGWRGWAAGVAAAAVLAVIAGAVGFAVSDQRVRTERGRVAAAQAQAAAAQAQNAQMTRILTASDAEVRSVRPAAGGDVTVIVSPRLNQGVAVLADMPALPAGQVYQLWLIHGDQPVAAGVMDPGVFSGTAFLTNVEGATSFGVSAEHAGGARSPHVPLVTSFAIST